MGDWARCAAWAEVGLRKSFQKASTTEGTKESGCGLSRCRGFRGSWKTKLEMQSFARMDGQECPSPHGLSLHGLSLHGPFLHDGPFLHGPFLRGLSLRSSSGIYNWGGHF